MQCSAGLDRAQLGLFCSTRGGVGVRQRNDHLVRRQALLRRLAAAARAKKCRFRNDKVVESTRRAIFSDLAVNDWPPTHAVLRTAEHCDDGTAQIVLMDDEGGKKFMFAVKRLITVMEFLDEEK